MAVLAPVVARKRPDPPGCEAQGGPGLVTYPVRRQAQMTNCLTQWLAAGSVPADTQRQKKAPDVPGL
jgi:hypothetical protein